MKKLLWCVFILGITIVPSLAMAEEVVLSADEAVSLALRQNRDILLKSEDLKKAKAKIAEANAGLFPTLNLAGAWTYTRQYFANKDLSQTAAQAALKQYLYKGGKVINTIKYNGLNFEIAQTLLDKTKLETALNVSKAFYTLLLAKDLADLNKGILDNTQKHLDYLKARYQNGQASESEILKIESSLSSLKQAFEAALNQVESGASLLKNLLYLDEKVIIKPQGVFAYEPKEVAFDQAFLKALKNRPEIKQYELQAKANERAVEIAKADGRPNIYASWDYYSRSHSSVATTTRNWNDHNVIGLNFSWPIFDGWATKAKVEQALVDLKEARLSGEKAAKDIALELKNSYIALSNALSLLKASESDILVFKDNLTVAQKRALQGNASTLDVNDAELKYAISRFNQTQAIYDYIVAKASFDKATGGS